MSTAAAEAPARDVDLVNAALLGTDRRPVAVPTGEEPAGWLLEAAARRRAESLVAAASTVVRPGPPGPAPTRPAPSLAARAVLDELLLSPSTLLVDLWLREALDAGTGLAPEHWTPLLDRARRATGLDRRRLAAALGPRGLWFARHNPAWSAVVRAAEAPGSPLAAEDAAGSADVQRLSALTVPVRAARDLGQRLGARLPLTAYVSLVEAARAATTASGCAALGAAEEVVWVRWGLAHAFDPARLPPVRRPVTPVPEERR